MVPPRRKKPKYEPVEINSSFDEISSDSQDSSSFEHWSIQPSPVKKSQTTINNNQQWIDKYRPKTTSEICINPTKLKQVKESMMKMINKTSNTRVLVLSGPSGSSKSTTVKLLAEELITVRDAFDSVVVEYDESEDFSKFLQDCRYKSKNVILVEELPNIYHLETLKKFRDAIRDWIYQDDNGFSLPPLIICLSEIEYDSNDLRISYSIENNLTVDTLLGKEITGLNQVENIKFNSIANRFLKPTINKIIKQEGILKIVNQQILMRFLDEIFQIGDIRSIIFNLEMWIKNVKQSSTNRISIDSFMRENSINLFHAIGKIIYSSSKVNKNRSKIGNNDDDSDPLDKDDIDYQSIEQVLQSFPEKNMDLLNLSLLENYHIYQDSNYDLKLASNIVDDLSVNDIIKLGDTGIRSTRINLSKAQKLSTSRSTSMPPSKLKMKFPRHLKMIKMMNKTKNQISSYRRYLNPQTSFQDLNLIDGYYMPIIYNSQKKTRYRYNRLGGKFQEVYADDVLPIDEGEVTYEYDQFEIDIKNKINLDSDMKYSEVIDEDIDNMSDPIESDDDLEDIGDIGDNESDAFSSDSELELLLTQGKV
ncbi:cell cycle checkpoint protein [Candida albicans P94015]|nr:cell cycle checkpoint protein [Candida albicans P94015]